MLKTSMERGETLAPKDVYGVSQLWGRRGIGWSATRWRHSPSHNRILI